MPAPDRQEVVFPGDAPAPRLASRWLPALLAVAGLALALFGTLPPQAWSWTDWRPSPTAFVFAHGTVLAVLTAGAMFAMAITIVALWVGRRRLNDRAKKRSETEPTRNEKLLLAALVALVFGLVATFLYLHGLNLDIDIRRWPDGDEADPAEAERTDFLPGFISEFVPDAPAWILRVVSTVFFAGMLLTAMAALIVAGYRLRDLARRRATGAAGSDRAASEVAQAAEESLEDFDLGGDSRAAVIACYARFERALAAAEVPRAPWQTPLEFMRAALGALPLDPADVERLTHLFERARFSPHPLGEAERTAALEALVAIRAALAQRRPDAPTD
ncbi:MAG: DUF4129 domain-containing protein [Alphaproteobacteria bacterium]|nr:DUF4129 domain-containing protein [Alphaproteobacteria bacterium]